MTFRGNARQEIFRDDRDRERFLRRLGESAQILGMKSGVSDGLQVRRAIAAGEGDKKVARPMEAVECDWRKMSDGKAA